jgi:RecA-family ATPase
MYEGPLARSQKYSDISSIERGLTLIEPLTKLAPTVIDNFDTDETARYIWEAAGNPIKLLRDKKEVSGIRDVQHKEMQAQQQHQQAVETAGAAKDAATAIKTMQPEPQQGAASK